MSTTTRSQIALAIVTPALVFAACTFITFSASFQQHTDSLELAILIDMLFTAPLLYYLTIYKTAIAKITVLRVFIVGALLTTVILSKSNSVPVAIIRTYFYPIAEVLLVSYIVYKFYSARKRYTKSTPDTSDFLIQSRTVLTSLLGSAQIANVMAAEIAVFYYIFSKSERLVDETTKFTSYRENGSRLILFTLLALLVIETVGVHFLLQLWSQTTAWVLTALSSYTCLQLFAHIRSLKTRPTVITTSELHLRNGILGGEVVLKRSNIDKIEFTNRNPSGPGILRIAFVKELENHNLAIYLKEPVSVLKAFGRKQSGKVLLVSVDQPKVFIAALAKRAET